MHQPFAPIHHSALSLQLRAAMAGALKRNSFLQALTGMEPADQDHAFTESQPENLKSLFVSGVRVAAVPSGQSGGGGLAGFGGPGKTRCSRRGRGLTGK